METVHETDAVFEAVAESGLRATIGKCMMDAAAMSLPASRSSTQASIDESLALRQRWHGAADGRIRVAFAPRFAVSCTRELLEAVAALVRAEQSLVHTHASESRDEIAIVRRVVRRPVEHRVSCDAVSSRRRACAPHIACGWTSASRRCWRITTSR